MGVLGVNVPRLFGRAKSAWNRTWAGLPEAELAGGVWDSSWIRRVVLILVAFLAFFYILHLSLLEGSEGLYAHIAKEMLHSRDFSHLTYQGEPYINKLPLFFWTLAFFTTLLGEHEVSLRLPAAISSLGTMALVYSLGNNCSRAPPVFGPRPCASPHR